MRKRRRGGRYVGSSAGGAAWRRSDRGAVTAEFAVALPAVVLILAAILSVSAASVAHMRSADAARAGARMAAIGEDDAAIAEAVQRVGGASATVQVSREGEWTRVNVHVPVAGGWFSSLPLRAGAKAVAWTEP